MFKMIVTDCMIFYKLGIVSKNVPSPKKETLRFYIYDCCTDQIEYMDGLEAVFPSKPLL